MLQEAWLIRNHRNAFVVIAGAGPPQKDDILPIHSQSSLGKLLGGWSALAEPSILPEPAQVAPQPSGCARRAAEGVVGSRGSQTPNTMQRVPNTDDTNNLTVVLVR